MSVRLNGDQMESPVFLRHVFLRFVSGERLSEKESQQSKASTVGAVSCTFMIKLKMHTGATVVIFLST